MHYEISEVEDICSQLY